MSRTNRERCVTFTVTEDYIARYLAACKAADISGVGSLVSLIHAKGSTVTVYPGGLRCSVHWDAQNKHHREVLWYDSLPVCYELSDGILLRVSKSVVLYLPVTEDIHSNKSLLWLRKQLRSAMGQCMTYGVLTGAGIGGLSRMQDKLRVHSKQRSRSPLGLMFVAVWILPFVLGVGFLYGAWHGGPVPYEDTVSYTGAFQSYYTVRAYRAVHSYLDLEGREPLRLGGPHDSDGLNALTSDAKVQVALHPRTDEVMEIVTDDKVLLEFDVAYKSHNRVSALAAAIACACLFLGAYFWIPVLSSGSGRKRARYDAELELRETNRRRKNMPSKQRRKKR